MSGSARRGTPHFIQPVKEADDESPTIKVCVRVRPFIKEELEGERGGGGGGGAPEACVAMPTKDRVELSRTGHGTRHFDFDRCFWSFSEHHPLYATQEVLHQELGETMLGHAMKGYNNCIFAYGQTGSGKTWSVLGGPGENRGLLPRVVEGLFQHFAAQEAQGCKCKALVSFLEIYNEQLRDLLAQADEPEKKLEVKQNNVYGIYVSNLNEKPVTNSQDVDELINYGITMRKVSATAMNATSSRSHCIFTFKTAVHNTESGEMAVSQTHLVDLAGSERTKRTKATGERLKEGTMINQSLSTLSRVISALASSTKKKKKQSTSVPYRESKLTHILKESLSGNSKTIMMAAISPSLADYEETLSTLHFAQSVKQVKTKALCNTVSQKSIEEQLKKELESLRGKLECMQAEETSPETSQLAQVMERLEYRKDLLGFFGMRDDAWEMALQAERGRKESRETFRKSVPLNSFDVTKLPGLQRLKSDSGGSESGGEEWDPHAATSDSEREKRSRRSRAIVVKLKDAPEGAESDFLSVTSGDLSPMSTVSSPIFRQRGTTKHGSGRKDSSSDDDSLLGDGKVVRFGTRGSLFENEDDDDGDTGSDEARPPPQQRPRPRPPPGARRGSLFGGQDTSSEDDDEDESDEEEKPVWGMSRRGSLFDDEDSEEDEGGTLSPGSRRPPLRCTRLTVTGPLASALPCQQEELTESLAQLEDSAARADEACQALGGAPPELRPVVAVDVQEGLRADLLLRVRPAEPPGSHVQWLPADLLFPRLTWLEREAKAAPGAAARYLGGAWDAAGAATGQPPTVRGPPAGPAAAMAQLQGGSLEVQLLKTRLANRRQEVSRLRERLEERNRLLQQQDSLFAGSHLQPPGALGRKVCDLARTTASRFDEAINMLDALQVELEGPLPAPALPAGVHRPP